MCPNLMNFSEIADRRSCPRILAAAPLQPTSFPTHVQLAPGPCSIPGISNNSRCLPRGIALAAFAMIFTELL